MANENAKPEFFLRIAGFACVVIAFILWITYQVDYSVNTDNAVLTEFARRMLTGGKFGIDYSDTNPPFSIILYTPAVLISWLTQLPQYHALTLYIVLLQGLSIFLVWKILKRFSFLRESESIIFTIAYAAAALAMANIYFGERDHIILLGLVPLLLAQFAINENITLPRRYKFLAILFGAIVILIKPHYGLMPVLMIGWRIINRKNLKALFASDFIILAVTTLVYIVINAIFFSQYWTDVAPGLIDFYIGQMVTETLFSLKFKIAAFIDIALLVAFATKAGTANKRFFLMLALAATCLLITYLAQYKGYSYHLIPALIMTFTLVATFAASLLKQDSQEIYVLLPLIAFLLVFFPVRDKYPTHREYAQLPMGHMLDGCPQPCKFLALNDYNYMTFETGMYKHAFHASRFSSLWFQPGMSCNKEKYDALFPKYSAMVTEDFARWKPARVALLKGSDICPDGREIPFDFVSFFSMNPDFAKEWRNYEPAFTLNFNRRDYFGSTSSDYNYPMNFEIYKRKDSAP